MPASNWLWVVLALGLAFIGFHGYANSGQPIPQPLTQVSAPIEEVDVARIRFRVHLVKLRLRGHSAPFFYDATLDGRAAVADMAQRGRMAQVVFSRSPSGETQLWGLAIDGRTLLTPAEAHVARRDNAVWGLWFGVSMLACGVVLIVWGHQRGGRAF
jgi:hypothetical protein